ncbi:hypothetical protein [Ferruginibacter albus]|uniref:hypothetical protein n=1 Tax=Ferruginibacter albus TaxID=2875540 RepID=UPI001CC7F286|nr:hypothetical protein [Ferruginibacter albus]UAY50804.1 hypothetical protein K9M53_09395 [Ferruginibacter albus]
MAQPPSKSTAKYKPPVVSTTLGNITGDGVSVSVESCKQLIASSLSITDSKKTSYELVSYQFSYKRIGIKEDEANGQPSVAKDMVADRFKTTPLPPIWIKTIQDELHSGEELYFFDIVVKDKENHLFFAPELRIVAQ